jgi:hypothetical protein
MFHCTSSGEVIFFVLVMMKIEVVSVKRSSKHTKSLLRNSMASNAFWAALQLTLKFLMHAVNFWNRFASLEVEWLAVGSAVALVTTKQVARSRRMISSAPVASNTSRSCGRR